MGRKAGKRLAAFFAMKAFDAVVRDASPAVLAHCVAIPFGFRCSAKKLTISVVERTRLAVFRQPCPSSGKRVYFTGTPRAFMALTICSASTTGTLVSFAP